MASSNSSRTLISTSIIVSVVLHLSCFIGLGAYVHFSPPEEIVEKEPEPEEKEDPVTVTLGMMQPELSKNMAQSIPPIPAEVKQDPDIIPEPEDDNEKEEEKNAIVVLPSQRQMYERTSAEQETSERPKETNLYGSRNTVAASDRTPDEGAPEVAAVDGIKSKDNDDIIDTRFRDGDLENEGGGDNTATAGDPDAVDQTDELENMEEVLKRLDPLGAVAEANAESPQEGNGEDEMKQDASQANRIDDSETVKVGDEIAQQQEQALREKKRAQERANALRKKAEELAKAEQQRHEAEEALRKKKKGQEVAMSDPFAKAAGMTSEVKKNRVKGSISRKGVASRNVKATPLGRYKNSILRAVEKKWQIEVQKKIDRVLPGSLSVIVYVNKNGKVVNTNFVDAHAGTQIQKGITYQAIKKATIPKMSSALQSELHGQPVEVWITFTFN